MDWIKRLSPTVKVLSNKNGGLSAARNAGLSIASGMYIQFLDSDDLLIPGKIDLQIAQLQSQPRLDISITNYLLCDEEATHFWRDGDSITPFSCTLEDFLFRWERGFSIPIHCAVFRREVFNNAMFDTSITGKEDWVFWCMQAHAGAFFGYLPVYGAVYRQHNSGMSKSFKSMGDSWLSAARLIERHIGGKFPDFPGACESWHESFYRPAIKNQQAERTVHKPSGVFKSPALDRDAFFDHDWIAGVPNLRRAPPLSPSISIIVPVFNHFEYLHECLSSLAAESANSGGELVIIDDASTDSRVWPLLKAFAGRVSGVCIHRNERNLGISNSQNIAANLASGDYLAFVDCDDSLHEGALAQVTASLISETDYLFTDREDIAENGARIRIARYGGYDFLVPSGSISSDLVDGMVASHLKVIRRSAYIELGGCDPEFEGVQDWDLALRFAAAGKRFQYLPKAIYRHRIHTNSVTRGDSVRQLWLTNRVRRKYLCHQIRRGISTMDACQRALSACEAIIQGRAPHDNDVLVINGFSSHHYSNTLRGAWAEGRVCIYAPAEKASLQELNLVREYNSYFDAIIAPTEAIAACLLGYLWDQDILVLLGEPRPFSLPQRAERHPEAPNSVELE